MNGWVNFKEIRARVSLEDVLFRFYKLDGFKRHGGKLVGPCPVHGGDSPRAFHAELSRNIWHCFSQCQGGGNQLDFVAKREGISIREAALKLQAFFLGDDHRDEGTDRAPTRRAPRSKERRAPTPNPQEEDRMPEDDKKDGQEAAPKKNPPLELTLQLKPDHPHLLQDRGLALETCKVFGVGYCARGIMRGCIAIPIHDEDGVLVAYAGRRLKPQDVREHGKYKLPKGFRKDLVLYNWHRVREDAATHGVILVEGFFSVFKLHEAGLRTAVACMGCELSDHQAELLTEAKDVIVLFDGNAAGQAGARRVKDKLEGRVPVRVAALPDKAEPDDLSPKALRWLVNGMRALDLDTVSFWARANPDEDA